MMTMIQQRGMGLVEVLVALLLLAVAVLGFSAMQLTAVKATDESLMRTQSIALIKSMSESMRILPNSSEIYKTQVNTLYIKNHVADDEPNIDSYCTAVDTYQAAATDCDNTVCTIDQLVRHNVAATLSIACTKEIAFNMQTCPDTRGTNERQCLIAAWGQTKPVLSDDKYACADADGLYEPAASCFIVEAY